MNAIKERIIGAVTVMTNSDAARIWEIIQDEFTENDWNNFDEVEPTEEEQDILSSYNPDTEDFISHEELKKELGLQ